jgi:hypothetical protein
MKRLQKEKMLVLLILLQPKGHTRKEAVLTMKVLIV